jgi:hypothetical protein
MITATVPVTEQHAEALFEALRPELGEIVVMPIPESHPGLSRQLIFYLEPEDWTPENIDVLERNAFWWLWAGENPRAMQVVGPEKSFFYRRGKQVGELEMSTVLTEEELEHFRSQGWSFEVGDFR